jgi:hypothetical protein
LNFRFVDRLNLLFRSGIQRLSKRAKHRTIWLDCETEIKLNHRVASFRSEDVREIMLDVAVGFGLKLERLASKIRTVGEASDMIGSLGADFVSPPLKAKGKQVNTL